MKRFQYKAIDKSGQINEGHYDAPDAKDLNVFFLRQGLTPVKIEEEKEEETQRAGLSLSQRFSNRLLESELIAFTRQFAAAYGAGVPVGKTLALLAKQTPHLAFKDALHGIANKVDQGMGLSMAFQKYPHFFSATYIAILSSGEVSGNLDEVLDYSANLLERNLLHKEKIRSTLLYPKLVLGMIGITMTVVITFVIPQFAKLYEKFETPLPVPTQIMIAISKVVVNYWWLGIMSIPAMIFLIRYLRKNETFMLWFHERLIYTPIFGPTFLKIELTQFCTTFALLLRSGIRITDGANIAIRAMKNTFMREQLAKVVETIEMGGTLEEALEKIPVVPPLMASMVAVGEETGTLEKLLDRVATLYDHETDMALKKLPTVLEPLVLAGLFILVFFLALAVYLPMWKMATLLRR